MSEEKIIKSIRNTGEHHKGKFKCSYEGKKTKEYTLWSNMLKRCYSKSVHERKPTYIGCEVSVNFKDFQFFAQWCQDQIGFGLNKYQLDKDLLQKGNKIYSEDVCVFVPHEVNLLLNDKAASRGRYPKGVYWSKQNNKFYAQVGRHGVRCSLGYFLCVEEAHQAYIVAKEAQVKVVADSYKDYIDPRVYNMLMNWKAGSDNCGQ